MNPYSIIEEYWDDRLTAKLVTKILNAPRSHREAFAEYALNVDEPQTQLLALEPGRLRPVVSTNFEDRLLSSSVYSFRPAHLASSLLIYAHEALVNDPIRLVTRGYDYEVRRVLNWLIAIRSLHEAGVVHFQELESLRRHPSRMLQNTRLTNRIVDAEGLNLDELMGRNPDLFSTGNAAHKFWDKIAEEMAQDAFSDLLLTHIWPGKVNLLARSELGLRMYKHVEEHLSQATSASDRRLLNLVRLTVPHFAEDYESLAIVRRDEESFAELREQIAMALADVKLEDPDNPTELAAARYEIYSRCEPSRVKAEAVISKSPALSALQNGLSSFGIATVGASGGFLVGGSLPTALASAGAAKAAEIIVNLRKAFNERRQAKAMLSVITTFFPPVNSAETRDRPPAW